MMFFIPSCREAVRLESRSLDEPLGLGDKLRLVMHQAICKACRRYSAQLHFLHDNALKDEKLFTIKDARLSHDARERIAKALKHGGDK